MSVEVQTRSGRCPNHGSVEGTREIPRVQFPFLYYGARRSLAKRRPFQCPECGAPLEAS